MDTSAAAREFASEAGKYRAQLLRFAARRLGNPAHAEDAVQDALVAAIESLERYAGQSSLATWLTGILRNKIVDCIRASVRERGEALSEDLAAEHGDPEQALWRRAVLECVARRLAALPRRASEVFVMRDVIGMSTAETCAALAISESHCAVLLHRARRRLREKLAADGIEAAA